MRLTMMISLIITLLSGMYISVASADEPTGITLHSMRVIYPGSAKNGVNFSLTNNNTISYLIQAWIRPLDPVTGGPIQGDYDSMVPFIITPPLKKILPGEQQALLIRLTQNHLPQDRESVFYLSIKAIPGLSEQEANATNKMIIAAVNNIKLFYRPEGLPSGGIEQAEKQLMFSRQYNNLVVTNPTPFYLNFSALSIDGKGISSEHLRLLVPPKGSRSYPIPAGAVGEIHWQLLDEKNTAMPGRKIRI